MSDEDEKSSEPAQLLVPTVIKRFWRGFKDGMLGSIGSNVESIGASLNTIKDILRPGLTKIAHSLNKPYVEPTVETDFLERWNEIDNKEEIFQQISEKYREMLHSIPDRSHWRL